MCSELWTGLTANEAQMSIAEGQTANLRQRHPHDRAGRHRPFESRRTTASSSCQRRCWKPTSARLAASRTPICRLPFRCCAGSTIPRCATRKAGEPNPATAGSGRQLVADEARARDRRRHGAERRFPGRVRRAVREVRRQIARHLLVRPRAQAAAAIESRRQDVRRRPAAQTDLLSVHAHAQGLPLRPLHRHEHAEEFFVAGAARGSGAQRRPRSADLDEQPAALRGHDVLPGRLGQADGAGHRAASGEEPRLDGAVRRLHAGDDRHARPLRRRAHALPRPDRTTRRASFRHAGGNAIPPRLCLLRLSRTRRRRSSRATSSAKCGCRTVAAERNANLRVRQAAARVPGPRQAVRHGRPQHAANPLRPPGSSRHGKRRKNARKTPAIAWLLDSISDAPAGSQSSRFPHRESRAAGNARARAARRLLALFAQRNSRSSSTSCRSKSTSPPRSPKSSGPASNKPCSSWRASSAATPRS